MQINSESHIRHSPQRVLEVYQDLLPEVAAYMPDIREIRVENRKDGDGVVELQNVWSSDRDIPSYARAVLKPEHLKWDDFVKWHREGLFGEWEIKTRVFTDAVTCSGRTELHDDGKGGTRVTLTGHFNVDLQSVPGIPGFLGRRIAPKLEGFIVNLITPNLEKTNVAIGEYLDAQD
ncbi:MAG: hypothetical protein JRI25_24670 [Deltaproteobacteria bacterium]|nr:hypothetical protein [Deltaproteobacteria bacterium]MBW2257773.1 hypothetical protein [Deltaproteobacteria bacterium]